MEKTKTAAKVTIEPLPVRRADGAYDAVDALITFNGWFVSSREFFLTPGQNQRHAQEWADQEVARVNASPPSWAKESFK